MRFSAEGSHIFPPILSYKWCAVQIKTSSEIQQNQVMNSCI